MVCVFRTLEGTSKTNVWLFPRHEPVVSDSVGAHAAFAARAPEGVTRS